MEIDVAKLPSAIQELGNAMRWAAVTAGNRTAFLARSAALQSFKDRFTVRNKWAQSQIRYKKATVDDMVAEIVASGDGVAIHEEGGAANVRGLEPVPVDVYEAFGISQKKVIPRSLRAGSIVGKKVKGLSPYLATKSGMQGVWADTDAGQKLLYVLSPDLTYEPRPWFYEATEQSVNENLSQEYDKAIEEQWDRAISMGLSSGSALL